MDSCSSGRGGGRNPGGFQSMFIGAGNLAAKGGRAPDERGVASLCKQSRRWEEKRRKETRCVKENSPYECIFSGCKAMRRTPRHRRTVMRRGENSRDSKDARERPNNSDEGKMLGFFFCQVWRWRQTPAWFRCQTPRQGKKELGEKRRAPEKKERGTKKNKSAVLLFSLFLSALAPLFFFSVLSSRGSD